ncbi:isocitrate lyase/phosphoenolpyruvate mutase family protein [Chitinimonas viridis]|uniref:Isocitrate lyase/phosphoenolpyruvate mutase family protein n=1 Tax=Chitinimonas viridis TaxID=664880 RepID=A0ABT8B863_9NEIS|nr:isocitrate lyase/phosphoenolpyruvate mutase family protein [Chitinimonas viridis]MDN3578346.1 isocitrate lyase/phosphoenolpyruvate mutase family protein [Chitinimonas viridis]
MTVPNHIHFCALHTQPKPLVLPNAWDAASAAIFQRAGAPAVATSSAALAWSLGYADGSTLPRHELLAAIARIQRVLTVPLTVDLEDGYSNDAKQVAGLVVEVAQMGVTGINLEDGAQPYHLLAEKIAACRQALCKRPLFINARTDVYLRGLATGAEALELTLMRAQEYQGVGADGLFVPGLSSIDDTAFIAARTALPVNLMLLPDMPPIPALFAAGARRFTAGPANFLLAYGRTFTTTQALLDAHQAADLFADRAVEYAEMNALFS